MNFDGTGNIYTFVAENQSEVIITLFANRRNPDKLKL